MSSAVAVAGAGAAAAAGAASWHGDSGKKSGRRGRCPPPGYGTEGTAAGALSMVSASADESADESAARPAVSADAGAPTGCRQTHTHGQLHSDLLSRGRYRD